MTSARYRKTYPISWEQLHRDSRALAWRLLERDYFKGIIAITRGGLVPAAIVARELDIRLVDTVCVSSYDWQDQRGEVEILKTLDTDGDGWLLIDDLVDTAGTLCLAALDGRLDKVTAEWDARASLGVVLAAGGYPDAYRKGDVIEGLPAVDETACKVFHAGTTASGDAVLTSGGRVLCVCALGDTIAAAQQQAYACAGRIHWRDVYYRTDIGYRAITHGK